MYGRCVRDLRKKGAFDENARITDHAFGILLPNCFKPVINRKVNDSVRRVS